MSVPLGDHVTGTGAPEAVLREVRRSAITLSRLADRCAWTSGIAQRPPLQDRRSAVRDQPSANADRRAPVACGSNPQRSTDSRSNSACQNPAAVNFQPFPSLANPAPPPSGVYRVTRLATPTSVGVVESTVAISNHASRQHRARRARHIPALFGPHGARRNGHSAASAVDTRTPMPDFSDDVAGLDGRHAPLQQYLAVPRVRRSSERRSGPEGRRSGVGTRCP
jgi:hypothetical protein